MGGCPPHVATVSGVPPARQPYPPSVRGHEMLEVGWSISPEENQNVASAVRWHVILHARQKGPVYINQVIKRFPGGGQAVNCE